MKLLLVTRAVNNYKSRKGACLLPPFGKPSLRRSLDTDRRRGQLIAVARLLLGEDRYEHTQVDRVACRCRVNGGLA